MRAYITFLAVFLYATFAHSQEAKTYHPFIEEGKVWEITKHNDASEWKERFYFSGDTIILGQVCKKMLMCRLRDDGTTSTPNLYLTLFEDGLRVKFFNPGSTEAQTLYDFGAEPGGEVNVSKVHYNPMHDDESISCHVIYNQPLPYGDSSWPVLWVAFGNNRGSWIEGVGSTNGILSYTFGYYGDGTTRVVCTVEGDTIFDSHQFSDNLFRRMDDVSNNKDIAFQPFLENGKEWIVGEKAGASHYTSISTYSVEGDTIVSGQKCNKLIRFREFALEKQPEISLAGCLFERDRQVWGFLPSTSTPRLIYDFGHYYSDTVLVRGGNETYDNGEAVCLWVGLSSAYRKDSIKYRTFEVFYNNNQRWTWTEGIGSWASPLRNICLNEHASVEHLLWAGVGETCLFENIKELELAQEEVREGLHFHRDSDSYYRPYIETGKVWQTVSGSSEKYHYYYLNTYWFEGDSILSGYRCTKMMRSKYDMENKSAEIHLVAPMYEEDGKVWFFVAGETSPRLMFDFKAVTGETIYLANPEPMYWEPRNMRLSSLDKRRTYTALPLYYIWEKQDTTVIHYRWYSNESSEERNDSFSIVPGIGSLLGPLNNHPNSGNSETLVSCSLGDEILYFDNAYEQFVDVIHDLPAPLVANDNSNNGIFDLSGRRLSTPPAKGVYIENGRKRLTIEH